MTAERARPASDDAPSRPRMPMTGYRGRDADEGVFRRAQAQRRGVEEAVLREDAGSRRTSWYRPPHGSAQGPGKEGELGL